MISPKTVWVTDCCLVNSTGKPCSFVCQFKYRYFSLVSISYGQWIKPGGLEPETANDVQTKHTYF